MCFLIITECLLYSNVTCSDEDIDLINCKSEKVIDSDQLCDHSKDVAFRCEQPGWTGLRLGVLADTCNLQYVTIEKAGLFDYITNEFGPGMFCFLINALDIMISCMFLCKQSHTIAVIF